MRCTGNTRKRRSSARRRRNRLAAWMTVLLLFLCGAAAAVYFLKIDREQEYLAAQYEASHYGSLYRGTLYAEGLCVAAGDVALPGAPDMTGVYAAGLFDVNGGIVDFSYHIHDRVYPASTTKILTALVAIKNGDLSDVVTVSHNAAAASFAADESTCGLKEGDQLTLSDLLYGLLLMSGNDNAVAIAEHIAGSQEAFAEMMNAQAAELMATNSHFVNANGLHNDDHYTTAYDLYLIFNECIKHQEFLDIIGTDAYTAHVTGADGAVRDMPLKPTNLYAAGIAPAPANVTLVGGKTGTTKKAGSCLILMEKDPSDQPYISIVMGAQTKELLYQDMTGLIEAIPAAQ